MTPEEEKELWRRSDQVFAKADEIFRMADRVFDKAPEGETTLRRRDGVVSRVLRIFKRTK